MSRRNNTESTPGRPAVSGETLRLSNATIEGSDNTVYGNNNTIVGKNNKIQGNDNHAVIQEGNDSGLLDVNQQVAMMNQLHRQGTVAVHVIGNRNTTTIINGTFLVWGDVIVDGDNNEIHVSYAKVTGHSNTIHGGDAKVVGNQNTIHGTYVEVTGNHNTIHGGDAKVKGHRNQVMGTYSEVTGKRNVVEGNDSRATGNHNTVRGTWVKATGDHNAVEGDHARAYGNNNAVSGHDCEATGGADNTINGVPAEQAAELERARALPRLQELQQQVAQQQQLPATELLELQSLQMREQIRQHQLASSIQLNQIFQQQLHQIALGAPAAAVAAPATTTMQRHIQMTLRGQDEAENDENGNVCFICHANKAIVASTCCGKITTCLACSRTMYQNKMVGQVPCINCRADVEHVLRIC